MSDALLGSLNYRESADGVIFSVRVIPLANRDEILGVEGGLLKVRVNAPPVKGKANTALVRIVAKALGVKRWQVEIQRGENARLKTLKVRGLGAGKLKEFMTLRGKGDA